MKKNIFLVALILSVIFSLSACSSTAQEPIDTKIDVETVQNPIDTQTDINSLEQNDSENNASNDSETESSVVENPQVNGGNNVCTVHHIDYHTYNSCLANYVGYDSFREWFDQYSVPVEASPNGCIYPNSNIYEFIHYFDIPQDVLIKFYNEFLLPDYNIDLLYNGTAEDVDQYYRSVSDARRIEEIKISNFQELKFAIRLNNIDAFPEKMNCAEYSLIEMMLMTDTPVEFIYDRIERTRKKHGDSIYGSQYEYDFSLLNEKNRSELEKKINEHSAFYLDCIFCGITPYESRYEKQETETKIFDIEHDNVNEHSGGSTGCQVHGVEYHAIPNSLVNYVGDSEAVSEWLANVTENKTADGCPGTKACIYDFVVHFEIPKSVFIELYNDHTMRYDYPIDLLYSGTAEEIDTYYRAVDEDKELEKIKWTNLNSLKMDLVALIRDKTGESVKYREHSVIELVKMAGISEKELLVMETARVQADGENNILNASFNYDMRLLATDNKSVESLISEHSAYYLDCLFCGITPYETPYERQVGTLNAETQVD